MPPKKKPEPEEGEPAAVYVDIERLRPWANNPRVNKRAIPEVMESMKTYGFGSPIVARRANYEVIAGHTRLAAAFMLELKRVPVRLMDLTAVQAHSLALVDNKSGELSGWDEEQLADVMRELRDAGEAVDVYGLGWSEDAVDKMLGEDAGGGDDGEDLPPLQATVHSVLGEVYELGPHRLVCGDCTEQATWDLVLRGEKARLYWTDPPYGVAFSTDHLRDWDGGKKRSRDAVEIANDQLDPQQLKDFLLRVFACALHSCDAGSSWYISGPALAGPAWSFTTALYEVGVFRQMLVWVKDSFVLGRSDYHGRFEAVYYGWKPGAAHYFVKDRTQDTVHEFPRPKSSELHPTTKPVDLIARHVRNSSKRGWVVVDSFGGSGSTLIACAQESRVARVIELDPRYCDQIRRRWTRWARERGVDAGPGALAG